MSDLLKIFENKQALAVQYAADLQQWVKERNQLTIALSGGSTPKVLFQHLATHYINKIDWSKVHFFWGDERCVPPDDKESNYKMTYDLLLQYIPENQRNIYRIKGENLPQEEAIRYAAIIQSVVAEKNGCPQFDVMMLGMGDDGHTASIFPDQMELLSSNYICATAKHPVSGQIRVSLTGKVINNAKQITFLVTGSGKAQRMREIIKKEGAYKSYPAAHVKALDGHLRWYSDEAAVTLL
ncbi:MAG: 6-phosphogluconolactonase [Bacteroidota bacterium]